MDVISVDEYTSKIDKDNITIALYVSDKLAVKELKDYIEKYYLTIIKDIEISDTITDSGNSILFVEIERNEEFPKILCDMMDTIGLLCDNEWKFTYSKKSNPVELSLENIQKFIRLTEEQKKNVQETYSGDTFSLNDNGWVRKYKIVGKVEESRMISDIEKSETLNNRDYSELYLLEDRFPTHNIITTDKNIFLVNDDEILLVRGI